MTDFSAFAKMMPGFDFLQGLAQNANATMPGIGQWIAPTLDPAEIEKRIGELRTVQFWLEQNVRMVDATVRALEVQRMTLSTLRTMNVRMDDLRGALTIPPAPAAAAPAAAPAPVSSAPSAPAAAPEAGAGAGIDPLQWWGALTQQFTQIAANAMKDTTAEAARQMAGATAVRPDASDPSRGSGGGGGAAAARKPTPPAPRTGGRG